MGIRKLPREGVILPKGLPDRGQRGDDPKRRRHGIRRRQRKPAGPQNVAQIHGMTDNPIWPAAGHKPRRPPIPPKPRRSAIRADTYTAAPTTVTA
jgi:hypothetical protein